MFRRGILVSVRLQVIPRQQCQRSCLVRPSPTSRGTLSLPHHRLISLSSVNLTTTSDGIAEQFAADTSSQTVTSSMVEPSLQSLGLANNAYPSGWVQSVMEIIHNMNVPWWATIMITTLGMRLLVLPVVILSQKNMARLHNNLPNLQRLQLEAMSASSKSEARAANIKYHEFMTKNNLNPIKNYAPMICSGGVFMSMFLGIRGMASYPVESMKTEGILWFVNLTAQDPLFLLPIITTSSLYINLKFGGEGVNLDTMPAILRKFFFITCAVSIPVMCSFPAALNLYWCTNNLISITQAKIIRLPAVRNYLGIEQMIKHNPDDLPMNKMMSDMISSPPKHNSNAQKKNVIDLGEVESSKKKNI